MDDSRNDGRPSLRACLWRCVVGALLFAASFRYASEGINWSRTFHPDEPTIARWMRQNNVAGYVTERAYPGGWFELIRIKLRIDATASRIRAARERRRAQDGAVNATDPATFRRTPPPDNRFRRHIQYGRDFNSLLYALTALLLYLAALEAGLGTAGSAVSATFFLS